ncbi:MAG: tetratricopeptide repeat protein [Phycisphaerae bacterium]
MSEYVAPPADPALVPPACRNCRRAPLATVGALLRCAACGFIYPRRPHDTLVAARTADPDPPELARIAPNRVLRERYRLLRTLGRGAHGLAYYAEHEFLRLPCVVKLLLDGPTDPTDAAARRLRREAGIGRRITHPRLVRVIECDQVDGVWYFVRGFVPGVDLGAVATAGLRLVPDQAVATLRDAAAALHALHTEGVVHRDIKPENLLLTPDGLVFVADLGVATLTARASASTGASPAAGTLGYAAPETFESGRPPGPAADLYSLGAAAYHLLTGRAPFGDSVFRALVEAQAGAPEWPSDAAADTPVWLRAMVSRLLEPDPACRFASAADLLDALEVGAPSHTPPLEALPRSRTVGVALTPAGLCVLPFAVDGPRDDDWLGDALAEGLSRALGRAPQTYVVEAERALALAAADEFADEPPDARQRRTARLAGAARLVEGTVRRSGDTLAFRGAVIDAECGVRLEIAEQRGKLGEFTAFQHALYRAVAPRLALPAEPPAHAFRPTAFGALAHLVRARRAFARADHATALREAEAAAAQDPEFVEPLQLVGACYARLGRYDDAARQHHRQEALALERGDLRVLVEAQANLGVMHYFRGRYEDAVRFYAPAARRADELGLTAETAHICNNLGFALFRLGRAAEAEAAFRRAVAIHSTYGALAALIGPYNGLGNVLAEQGRHVDAREYYERARRLAEQVGDRTNVGVATMHLGRCDALVDRLDDAGHELAVALCILENARFWNGLARAYEYAADLDLRTGDYAAAVRCADKRIALARLHANAGMEAAAWRQRAAALDRCDQPLEAERSRAHAAALTPPA